MQFRRQSISNVKFKKENQKEGVNIFLKLRDTKYITKEEIVKLHPGEGTIGMQT